jgi:alpha-D-xyloside xylohydrolase
MNINRNYRRMILLITLICIARPISAAPIPVVSVTKDQDGITLHMNPGVMKLQVWSDRIIHVQYTDKDALPENTSLAVIGTPENVKWDYSESANAETLKTSLMSVRVNRHSGAITFFDSSNRPILAEQNDGGKGRNSLAQFQQTFRLKDEEGIYGLGQHQAGLMNYRGSVVHLQQANMDVAVPMLVSSAGYGLLWDNPSVTDVDVSTPTNMYQMKLSSEVADEINYYFIAGPQADDIIAGYRELTGQVPMMGRWAWGFWQCREHYSTQQQLLDVVSRYRSMNVPIDGIIQDWQYWPKGQWGSHLFDPVRYSDPGGTVAKLHAEHVHVLISVWPRFELITDNYKTLNQAGVLYSNVFGEYGGGAGQWYDAFDPKGRQLYWGLIAKDILPFGFDGWWLDASEPELGGHWGEFRDFKTVAGSGASVYNAYPLMHTTAVYQGQRADAPDKRVFILTRSAYAGQQRNAAVTWSGDIRGTWDVFRRQIPAGLNFSVSGIPYWNTDIGGFFGGRVTDPNYQELFTRWFEFGSFCPMFRVHGTGDSKEMWKWDNATQKILIRYDQLRYQLLPYIYSISWMVTHQGYTMMRPLVMDFRNDTQALNIPDEYMFGPALLICPVTQARASARSVYLPAGSEWYDFWTGKKYDGGQAVIAAAPIETMPIFVRGGSILPMGDIVQYAGENPEGPLELRVYPGKNAQFSLYNDEGDNYNYEKGVYSTIPIRWDDAGRQLTVGARTGEFPGMAKQRQFSIAVAGRSTEQSVNYDGSEISVSAQK